MKFWKYHGAGNDFIMIDNRDGAFDVKDTERIRFLCDRHFGIGADGLLTLSDHVEYDFKMTYANSDGSQGSMCGNGGRCIVHFAHNVLRMIKNPKHVRFLAPDGEHEAEMIGEIIRLKMQDVGNISERNGLTFLYSGTTPHHISFVKNLQNFPICEVARKIRDDNQDPKGVNINFVEIQDDIVHARTYERGVEDETLACGTGATSIAIALHHLGKIKTNTCTIKMPGGELTITFEEKNGKYQNIWLSGRAELVFEGEIKP